MCFRALTRLWKISTKDREFTVTFDVIPKPSITRQIPGRCYYLTKFLLVLRTLPYILVFQTENESEILFPGELIPKFQTTLHSVPVLSTHAN